MSTSPPPPQQPAQPLPQHTPQQMPQPWGGVPYGQPYPPQVSRDDATSGADRIVFAVASMLGGVIAGFAGGAVWAAIADPPSALVTKRGVFLSSEVSYDHRVVVTLWFLAVGLGLGLVAGAVVGWIGRRHGVAAVVAVLLMSAVASALAAWSGIHVFGPDLSAEAADASIGDMIKTTLTISSDIGYLGWPIGALVGLLIVTALSPGDQTSRTPDNRPH